MNPEAALINSVCKHNDAGVVFQDIDELFVTHADVWQSLKDYYTAYKAIPSVAVLRERHPYLESYDTPAETGYYLDKLRNSWLQQRMHSALVEHNAAIRSGTRAPQEILQSLMKAAGSLHKATSPVRDLDMTDYETAADEYEVRHKLAMERGGTPGIPFGIERLDAGYPTGQAPGHFIVYIGWSGHGKSWFSTLAACRAFEQGYRPMIVSLEMSPETVRDRVYTVLGSGAFRNTDLVRGEVDVEKLRSWGKEALEGGKGFPVIATDSADSVRPATIQAKIDQYKPDIVFLDYAQLFDDNKGSEAMTTRMMNVSREFKLMAVQNKIPVVLLTQATMSDKSDVNSPPMIEQVAWSKSIQNDSDLALAVHKYTDQSRFEVVARKNRHGPDFALELNWDLNTGVFEEIESNTFELEDWDDTL